MISRTFKIIEISANRDLKQISQFKKIYRNLKKIYRDQKKSSIVSRVRNSMETKVFSASGSE